MQRLGFDADNLCFEVLTWYHMQIAVKIDRALGGKLRKRPREMSDFAMQDADGSAKVAYMGLLKSVDALTQVYERNQSMHGEIMPLLTVLYELADEVTEEFPGHKNFRRPGFDA